MVSLKTPHKTIEAPLRVVVVEAGDVMLVVVYPDAAIAVVVEKSGNEIGSSSFHMQVFGYPYYSRYSIDDGQTLFGRLALAKQIWLQDNLQFFSLFKII